MESNSTKNLSEDLSKSYDSSFIAGWLLLLFLLIGSVAFGQTNITTCIGGTATLNAGNAPSAARTIQWQSSLTGEEGSYSNITNRINFTGSQSPPYTFTVAAADIGKFYRAQFRNAGGNLVGGNVNFRLVPISLPSAISKSRCGPGTIELTASGAPVGGGYKWYTSIDATEPISGATGSTYITPNLASTTSYYVSTIANGCESERTAVTARILNQVTLTGEGIDIDTDHPTDELEVGEPATFIAQSEIIDEGDVNIYQWFTSTDGINWTSVTNSNSQSFYIASVPEDLYSVRVDITPRQQNACYTNLDASGIQTIETGEIVVLPVEIIYLKAQKQDYDVVIEWATAMEQDNYGFEVQVSENGTNYRKLAFVEAKNKNSSVKQVYKYVDKENGKNGSRYYRLKQLDTSGKFEYFGPKVVEFGSVANKVVVYPNPFESELSLNIEAEQDGPMEIVLVNAIGKQLIRKTVMVEKGVTTEQLLVDPSLPQGVYFVTTRMGSATKYFKVLKK